MPSTKILQQVQNELSIVMLLKQKASCKTKLQLHSINAANTKQILLNVLQLLHPSVFYTS
jgi:hypothetical protein